MSQGENPDAGYRTYVNSQKPWKFLQVSHRKGRIVWALVIDRKEGSWKRDKAAGRTTREGLLTNLSFWRMSLYPELSFNVDHGYLEGLVRGLKAGILTRSDYHNLAQCDTLEGKLRFLYRGMFCLPITVYNPLCNLQYLALRIVCNYTDIHILSKSVQCDFLHIAVCLNSGLNCGWNVCARGCVCTWEQVCVYSSLVVIILTKQWKRVMGSLTRVNYSL